MNKFVIIIWFVSRNFFCIVYFKVVFIYFNFDVNCKSYMRNVDKKIKIKLFVLFDV